MTLSESPGSAPIKLLLFAFAIPQFVLVAACHLMGASRPYLINLDFAVAVFAMLTAARFAGRGSRFAQTLTGATALAIFASIEAWTIIGGVYMADPSMVLGMLRYALYWPWRHLAPVGGAVLLASALIAWLANHPGAKVRATAMLLVACASLAVAADAASRVLSGPNVVSSGTASLFRPYLNQLLSSSPPPGSPTAITSRDGSMAPYIMRIMNHEADRKLLSISVESLGLPNEETVLQEWISLAVAPIQGSQPQIKVTAHTSYGSTLEGEIREICALRLSRPPQTRQELSALGICAPHALARLGYRTKAWHGNSRYFYLRDQVYPAMGFQEFESFETFAADEGSICRKLFTGICDRKILDSASVWLNGEGKRFAHVMTLETHLPLASQPNERCAHSNPETCGYLVAMRKAMSDIGTSIAKIRERPLDVFIYGDHPPPFMSEEARQTFSRTAVPFVSISLEKPMPSEASE